jgi:hypothetical protein
VSGSGGSLTAASFAAGLHQRFTGNLSKSVTPLELVSSRRTPSDSTVLILSAGGRNPDILEALRRVIDMEPRGLIVMCSRTESPLVRLASRYPHVRVYEFDLPTGSDGFLATNSLLAFLSLLTRAYTVALPSTDSLPKTLRMLVYPQQSRQQFLKNLATACDPLWKREYLIVLHGDSTRPGALDFESKFTEAALGAVLPSDYRNFAHGRHHWLAKRSADTGVIALMSPGEEILARKTIALLPKTVPVVPLHFDHAFPGAGIASIVAALEITGLAGMARNIDPGRPGVPLFGRRIYNLKGFTSLPQAKRTREELAIWRKTGCEPSAFSKADLDYWKTAHSDFVARVTRQYRYRALALDYDETLCDSKDRMGGIADDTLHALTKVMQQGMFIGVATGRGKSVRAVFRSKLPPRLWPQLLLGYYNGSELGCLDNDAVPRIQDCPSAELCAFLAKIQSNRILSHFAEWECRNSQITIQPKTRVKFQTLWEILHGLIGEQGNGKLSLVRSGHSIDILGPGVSKRKLVETLRQLVGCSDTAILCIGDKGCWPGNDFALLSEPASLSVDECSFDANTCWNLSPSGYRGAKATIFYLNALRFNSTGATLRISVK